MADINVINIKNNNYKLYDQTAINISNSATSEYNQAVNNLDFDLEEDYTYLGIYSNDISDLEDRLETLESNVATLLEDMMYENQYLTIERIGSASITIQWPSNTTSNNHKTLYYSTNGTTWSSWSSSTTHTVTLRRSTKKLYFKGTNDSYCDANGSLGIKSSGSGTFKVYGNIMSLFYGDNFKGKTTFPNLNANNLLDSFFSNNTQIINASNLILPATTLTEYCYECMFSDCTGLVNAPELLPATTLTNNCYSNMFYGCTSLITTPIIPATTLASCCYEYMFQSCTSLTSTPELPATTLADYCYSHMFEGCTSLINVPAILPAIKLAESCYEYMFSGCTSLTTAPELVGEYLALGCYEEMFSGCSNLNYIKYSGDLSYEYIDFNASNNEFQDWVNGVASKGTFENPNNNNFKKDANYGIPIGWSYETQYLTIECIEGPLQLQWQLDTDGSLSIYNNIQKTIYYSLNNGTTWSSLRSFTYSGGGGSYSDIITLTAGQKIILKGNNDSYTGTAERDRGDGVIVTWHLPSKFRTIGSVGTFKVYGNIMSLIYGDNFVNKYNLNEISNNGDIYTHTFYKLFAYNGVVDASNLILPATTLATGCYDSMFRGCTLLTIAPKLPAIILKNSCYESMFEECTSLTTAPELPAVILKDSCYESMFKGCANLNKITMLANYKQGSNALTNWVYGVSSSGIFIESDYYKLWLENGYSGIPNNWNIKKIKEDYEREYFTTEFMVENSYNYNNISITSNGADFEIYYSLDNGNTWTTISPVLGEIQTHTISNLPNYSKILWKCNTTSLFNLQYDDSIHFQSDQHIRVYGNIMSLLAGDNFYHASIVGDYAFYGLFKNYNGNIHAENLIIPTVNTNCCRSMFENSNLTALPFILPAKKLQNNCYQAMFKNCNNILWKISLPARQLKDNYGCYNEMFKDCTFNRITINMMAIDMNGNSDNYFNEWLNDITDNNNNNNRYILQLNKYRIWDSPEYQYNNSDIVPSGWTVVEV